MARIGTTSATSPGRSLRAVTPHATNDLPEGPCRELKIGGAGNVAIVARDDEDPVIVAVNAGELLPVQAKAVRVDGTTATDIVAIY